MFHCFHFESYCLHILYYYFEDVVSNECCRLKVIVQ